MNNTPACKITLKTDFPCANDSLDVARNLLVMLLLSGVLLLTGCSGTKKLTGGSSVRAVSDSIWTYSISHPDGFTMNLATMTEPTEGVVVAYAATQGCHSRKQLGRVVRHAMRRISERMLYHTFQI